MNKQAAIFATLISLIISACGGVTGATTSDGTETETTPQSVFSLPDTGQSGCYNNSTSVACPNEGEQFFGQDAQYSGAQMSYQDNGDGTVTDQVTGLIWQKDPGAKVSWSGANSNASTLTVGGYGDWRLPTIKELYSLINFNGLTGTSAADATPYIDTTYFVFNYGDTTAGERYIDAQFWTSTQYVSTTMNGDATVFGVNFADGRIKGYPRDIRGNGTGGMMFARYVRGGSSYGVNQFVDNGNQTVSDNATGLIWQKSDDGITRNWINALAYCENLELAGNFNWRLPNAKELQSIVDYKRSPDTTGSAAIDPIFSATSFIDGNGQANYGHYWTSTTHLDGQPVGSAAVYVAFGEAQGYMSIPPGSNSLSLLDVHGAGAQRSDPKWGDPNDYPFGRGPQGDVIGIFNYVRCLATR